MVREEHCFGDLTQAGVRTPRLTEKFENFEAMTQAMALRSAWLQARGRLLRLCAKELLQRSEPQRQVAVRKNRNKPAARVVCRQNCDTVQTSLI